MYRYYLNQGAGFLSFTGSDPDLLKTIDSKVLQGAMMNRSKALEFYSEAMMSDKNPWTVAGVATKAWAKRFIPNSTKLRRWKLYGTLFLICRELLMTP